MADLRLLALTHLIAAGCGFAIAPRELLETEVVHNGFFETDTKRVLAAAVQSLRSENQLLVYRRFSSNAVTQFSEVTINCHSLEITAPSTSSEEIDRTVSSVSREVLNRVLCFRSQNAAPTATTGARMTAAAPIQTRSGSSGTGRNCFDSEEYGL